MSNIFTKYLVENDIQKSVICFIGEHYFRMEKKTIIYELAKQEGEPILQQIIKIEVSTISKEFKACYIFPRIENVY